jgi:3-dehydroquinate synthase
MTKPSAPKTVPYASGEVVAVDLPAADASYNIHIGENILSEAGTLINLRLGNRHCLIITDDNVGKLYLGRVEALLGAAGHKILPSIAVNSGENSKNFNSLQNLLNKMMQNGIDRKTLIIALGGGVIGDLAGFAASVALRGLDFVQIPTTLLAQVDSSVGGKTGINTGHGKNTVGAFYQPKLVIIDVNLLDSLPKRELQAGYAEIVKYGLIDDEPFFRWCQGNGAKLLAGDRAAQIQAVGVSCRRKAAIVAADEKESGARALLNLGHTFAHALESVAGFSNSLLHGEAVAIGLAMAFRLSSQIGLCPHKDFYDVRDHLIASGLPVAPGDFAKDTDRLIRLMAQDKKAQGGKLTLILAHGIGKAFISRDVKESEVRELWRAYAEE